MAAAAGWANWSSLAKLGGREVYAMEVSDTGSATPVERASRNKNGDTAAAQAQVMMDREAMEGVAGNIDSEKLQRNLELIRRLEEGASLDHLEQSTDKAWLDRVKQSRSNAVELYREHVMRATMSESSLLEKRRREVNQQVLKARAQVDLPTLLIFPDSQWMQRWDILTTVCLLFTALMTPYEVRASLVL